MAAKKFQPESKHLSADLDGDGVISDQELEISRALQEQEITHEKAEAQRSMAWFALWGMLLYPSLVVASEFFGLIQAAAILGAMASVYFVSVAGILAAFFGAQAFQNRK